MKKRRAKKTKAKSKGQFLRRPYRTMIRFNKEELRQVDERAAKARLSRAEFGRRKMLDIPVSGAEAMSDREYGATV